MSLLHVGAQRPTHVHLPAGNETSAALEALELVTLGGLELDDWQAWLFCEALREQRPEVWAAFEVALLVSRQNGKGALLEARQLAGLFYLHEPLQVHTAHEFKTAYEHFLRITNLVEACADFDRQVMRIRRGAGEQAIELKSGCRLRFLARSTGSGRGLTGDVVYLDEAFALTAAMMGALLPTLSAVPNPQVWYTSSAPRRESEVLHGVRDRGRAGTSPRLLYAEWGLEPDADPEDVGNWYAANPALGIRISEEFVRAELDAMRAMPEEFLRERLGVASTAETHAMAIPNWDELVTPGSVIADLTRQQWALAVTPDRKWAAIGKAGRTADGKLHVERVEHRSLLGPPWLEQLIGAMWRERRIPIRIHKTGPEAAFIGPLRAAGVEVVEVSSVEVAQATGQVIDAATAGQLVHLGQPSLDKAVKGAVLRLSADGASVWSQRQSTVEITPLQAVTVAAGGVPEPAAVDLLTQVF